MNAGITWIADVEREEPGCDEGYSYKWLCETRKMVNKGWRAFWRRRHMKPPQVSDTTPEQQTNMEVLAAAARSRAREAL